MSSRLVLIWDQLLNFPDQVHINPTNLISERSEVKDLFTLDLILSVGAFDVFGEDLGECRC